MLTDTITARFRAVAVFNRIVKPLKQWLDGKAALGENRHKRGGPSLGFWFHFAKQTLGQCDIVPLCLEMCDAYEVRGLEFVPPAGVFTLAVNHTLARWTPRLLATIHQAINPVRPDLASEWLVIVGYHEAELQKLNPLVRYLVPKIRHIHAWICQRWVNNVIRLPMGNKRASLEALRTWKERARCQPTLVFPEGRGRDTFGPVRPNAGRWLAKLDVPVLPVSMWWDETAHLWHIIFGPALNWSTDPDLHDLQIGLEIAEWLPSTLAPDWQDFLTHWRQATPDLLPT